MKKIALYSTYLSMIGMHIPLAMAMQVTTLPLPKRQVSALTNKTFDGLMTRADMLIRYNKVTDLIGLYNENEKRRAEIHQAIKNSKKTALIQEFELRLKKETEQRQEEQKKQNEVAITSPLYPELEGGQLLTVPEPSAPSAPTIYPHVNQPASRGTQRASTSAATSWNTPLSDSHTPLSDAEMAELLQFHEDAQRNYAQSVSSPSIRAPLPQQQARLIDRNERSQAEIEDLNTIDAALKSGDVRQLQFVAEMHPERQDLQEAYAHALSRERQPAQAQASGRNQGNFQSQNQPQNQKNWWSKNIYFFGIVAAVALVATIVMIKGKARRS